MAALMEVSDTVAERLDLGAYTLAGEDVWPPAGLRDRVVCQLPFSLDPKDKVLLARRHSIHHRHRSVQYAAGRLKSSDGVTSLASGEPSAPRPPSDCIGFRPRLATSIEAMALKKMLCHEEDFEFAVSSPAALGRTWSSSIARDFTWFWKRSFSRISIQCSRSAITWISASETPPRASATSLRDGRRSSIPSPSSFGIPNK